jgi:hypothetical protein
LKAASTTLEMRVPKHDAGGTAFADFVWSIPRRLLRR